MNHRVLSFTICICLASSGASASSKFLTYDDPQGDALVAGRPDLISIGSLVTERSIVFRLEFAESIALPSALAANSLLGFIDLDLDQNPATGAVSNVEQFGGGPAGLGVEMFVDLGTEEFTPGFAELVDVLTREPVAMATLVFEPTRVSVELPRSALANDGLLNYGVAVGGFTAFSDRARDAGLTPATTVPEPAAGWLVVSAGRYFVARRRRRR